MTALKPTTTQKIFSLRTFLYAISQASYTFANINKSYPFENLTEENAQNVIKAYENLILDVYKQVNIAVETIEK